MMMADRGCMIEDAACVYLSGLEKGRKDSGRDSIYSFEECPRSLAPSWLRPIALVLCGYEKPQI